MSFNRRSLLKGLSVIASLAIAPLRLFADRAAAFNATAPDAVLNALFADIPIEESDLVKLKIPDIAENGAVVPITISTDIEGVQSISIIIDNNPTPFSASFTMSDNVFADIATRVKMSKSSPVRAYVQTADKIYTTSKDVKVTIGGCGG